MRTWSVCAVFGLMANLIWGEPTASAELKIFGSRVTKVPLGETGPAFAGVSAQTPNRDAARDVIKFLTGPTAIPAITANGMEPG